MDKVMTSGLSSESTARFFERHASTEATGLTSIFSTIPPERVGLDGEYDHHGLAKRVGLAFSENFEPQDFCGLRISQRGTVVVLMGEVSNPWLLNRLVRVALGVSGAADVEVNGMSTIKPLRTYAEGFDYYQHASYAF